MKLGHRALPGSRSPQRANALLSHVTASTGPHRCGASPTVPLPLPPLPPAPPGHIPIDFATAGVGAARTLPATSGDARDRPRGVLGGQHGRCRPPSNAERALPRPTLDVDIHPRDLRSRDRRGGQVEPSHTPFQLTSLESQGRSPGRCFRSISKSHRVTSLFVVRIERAGVARMRGAGVVTRHTSADRAEHRRVVTLIASGSGGAIQAEEFTGPLPERSGTLKGVSGEFGMDPEASSVASWPEQTSLAGFPPLARRPRSMSSGPLRPQPRVVGGQVEPGEPLIEGHARREPGRRSDPGFESHFEIASGHSTVRCLPVLIGHFFGRRTRRQGGGHTFAGRVTRRDGPLPHLFCPPAAWPAPSAVLEIRAAGGTPPLILLPPA